MPGNVPKITHLIKSNAGLANVLLAVVLGACGTDTLSFSRSIAVPEDTSIRDVLPSTRIGAPTSTYRLTMPPSHGEVTLDEESATFEYTPAPNYNGADTFAVVGEECDSLTTCRTVSLNVSIIVTPVNDPPELPPLSDLTNSPESREVALAFPTHDLDGDALSYEISVSDPNVATTAFDSSAGILTVTQGWPGQAKLGITVTDGVYNVVGAITYTVSAQTKRRTLFPPAPRAQAVQITNAGQQGITFALRHNGARLHTSTAELIEDIRSLPDEMHSETFGRKLWRYIRDGTNHYYPITAGHAQHDPLLLLESFGWGFCGDVAAAYVSLSREAGESARGWGLQGHVVPEIYENGAWRLYDPDLGVYYLDQSGDVAGVEQLAEEPTLITAPVEPILGEAGAEWQYGEVVASIYQTTSDNILLTEDYFLPGRTYAQLDLPPGARLTYPARWRASPLGFEGQNAFEVIVHAQLRLDLPAGFTGVVDLPLVLWDVEGAGRIRMGETEYLPGDAELTAALQSLALAPQPVQIITSQAVSLYYLINPNRFNMDWANEIEITSADAWAADVAFVELPAANRLQF